MANRKIYVQKLAELFSPYRQDLTNTDNLSNGIYVIQYVYADRIEFEKIINDAWENKDQVNQNSDKKLKDTINQIIEDLDSGKSRVAEKINGEWITHQHIKKAIMLSFRIHGMETLSGPYSAWHDKAHLLKGKTAGWAKKDFEKEEKIEISSG